jgi:hypothetical protein
MRTFEQDACFLISFHFETTDYDASSCRYVFASNHLPESSRPIRKAALHIERPALVGRGLIPRPILWLSAAQKASVGGSIPSLATT